MQTPEQLATTIWGDDATGSQWQKQVEARVAQLHRDVLERCIEIVEQSNDANEALREEFAGRNRTIILEQDSWPNNAPRMIELYNRMIEGSRSGSPPPS